MINETNIQDYIGKQIIDSKGIFVKITDIITNNNEKTVIFESGRVGVTPLTRNLPVWQFCEDYKLYYL